MGKAGHTPARDEKLRAWRQTGLMAGSLGKRVKEEESCCGAPEVDEETGACRHCGGVLAELKLERRLDAPTDRNGRQVRHAEPVGENIRGPRTVFDPGKKDARGHPLSGRKRALYDRLLGRHKRYGSSPKRSYFAADQTRRRILDQIGFRDPRKISWLICAWVARHKIAQGRTLEATTTAAVYVAAVEQGYPVSYVKMVACSHVVEERLRRVVAMYLAKPPAGRGNFPVQLHREKFFAPNRHIRHICNELRLTPLVGVQAEQCAQDLRRRISSGHRPENKAAAAIKAICGERVSWKDLARVTGVQIASLKAYWRRVVPILELLGYLRPAGEGARDTGDNLDPGMGS